MMPQKRRLLVWTLLLHLLFWAGGSIPAAATVYRPAGPTVTAVDGSVAFSGPPVGLAVDVADVVNLGAATIVVGYDPAMLVPVGCQRGAQFSFGLCNLTIDQDDDGTADAVRFNVISLTGVTTAEASAAPLVTISWQAAITATIGASTPLTVTIDTLTDVDGIPLAATPRNGAVTILPKPSGQVFLPLVVSE